MALNEESEWSTGKEEKGERKDGKWRGENGGEKQSAAQVPEKPRSSQNARTFVSLTHSRTHMCILVHIVIKP